MARSSVPLTRGLQTLVDDEDYAWLSKFKWMARPAQGGAMYAVRDVRRRPNLTTKRMHREILGLANDDPREVDHRNGDTLDNRRLNLRACTKAGNMQNRRAMKNNTSGYKGVHKAGPSFRASIGIDGGCLYLGTYPTAEDAAIAYDLTAIESYGEFANTNIVPLEGPYPEFPERLTFRGRVRGPRGKLTEEQVRAARVAYAAGDTHAELAREHGISEPAMTKAVKGVTYKWVS